MYFILIQQGASASGEAVPGLIIFALLIAVLIWVIFNLLKLDRSDVSPARIILKTASVLALFRIACVWMAYYAGIASYSLTGIALIVTFYIPEGMLLSALFPGTGLRPAWSPLLYTIILLIGSFLIVGILAGIIISARRVWLK